MYKKPECFVLYGDWGKKAYEEIMNSKPSDKPLYTDEECKMFERAFMEAWNEAVYSGAFKDDESVKTYDIESITN